MDRERGRPLRLIVHGAALPGRWAIEGRQFIPQFKSATGSRIACDPAGRPRSWCAPPVGCVTQGPGMALWRHRRRLARMALGLSGLLALVGWWQATSLSPFEAARSSASGPSPRPKVAPRAGFVTSFRAGDQPLDGLGFPPGSLLSRPDRLAR